MVVVFGIYDGETWNTLDKRDGIVIMIYLLLKVLEINIGLVVDSAQVLLNIDQKDKSPGFVNCKRIITPSKNILNTVDNS